MVRDSASCPKVQQRGFEGPDTPVPQDLEERVQTRRHLWILLAAVTWPFLAATAFARDLTFEDRVNAQEAIERVYYAHQIGATKPFEEAVPRTLLEKQVRTYLKESLAVEQIWHTPVTSEMLQKELERMNHQSRMPDRLSEIYGALGNDSFLVQECLARQELVGRLTQNFYWYDSALHANERQTAEMLHAQLTEGTIDPRAKHPLRVEMNVERGGQADPTDRTGSMHRVSADGDKPGIMQLAPEQFNLWRQRLPHDSDQIGPLVEERDRYSIGVMLDGGAGWVNGAFYSVPKLSWDAWWEDTSRSFDESTVNTVASAEISLGAFPWNSLAFPGCAHDDSWVPMASSIVPDPRSGQTGLWTGSVMIIWGNEYSGSGGRYDPATDTWQPTSLTNLPVLGGNYTAIWADGVMIVWGGRGPGYDLNSGARYDPLADTWSPISTVGAPAPRSEHVAVWTGNKMIVWGGFTFLPPSVRFFNDGGVYDPVLDRWSPMSTIGAPLQRIEATAVWTGTRMLVWGGVTGPASSTQLNTGAAYDPVSDKWTPMSTTGAPASRFGATGVWTGQDFIVWGGQALAGGMNRTFMNTGGRYDPVTDTWKPTSTVGAPSRRRDHSAVWTGSAMVIWGGAADIYDSSPFSSGGRYDPITDTWSPTSVIAAPEPRAGHSAVWTGKLMIVWGGYGDTGGRYDPATDTWTPTARSSAPDERYWQSSIWTGSLFVIWGGAYGTYGVNTGGRYDPTTDTWASTTLTGAPPGRYLHTAVWTGSEMVVFGGVCAGSCNPEGERYDPVADEWQSVSYFPGYSGVSGQSAVWTGSRMVLWGGGSGSLLKAGAQYDPSTNTWTSTSTVGAPTERAWQTAVWTGREMIVWGGFGGTSSPYSVLNTGGRYDPRSDTWSPMSTVGAPRARRDHISLWTDHSMFTWGGQDSGSSELGTGGVYDPSTDTWRATSAVGAPSARRGHSAVWTGERVIVWGGFSVAPTSLVVDTDTGARYDPVSDTWTPTTRTNAPFARGEHVAAWSGDTMIIWGGNGTRTGAQYCVCTEQVLYRDEDGDGYGDPLSPISACPGLAGYATQAGDCDDRNPQVHPGATELCDHLDNNCDGRVDDGFDIGIQCSVQVDACHQVSGTSQCRANGSGAECTGVTALHDTSAPGIVCPGNAVVECPAIASSGGIATASDACDPSPVVVSNASAVLPLGVTIVTWTATDASGNSSSCQQSVLVRDTTPPTIVCPTGVTAECPTQPALGTASAADACDASPIVTKESPAAFPLGSTTVLWRATDASGNTRSCQQVVSEIDTTPPTLAVAAAPSSLWPPNHDLVSVNLAWQVRDACDPNPAVSLMSVSSSEPDDAPGSDDGETVGDIVGAALGTADGGVSLRAERSGSGPGRVYQLTYQAVDASGNSTPAFAVVTVPPRPGFRSRAAPHAARSRHGEPGNGTDVLGCCPRRDRVRRDLG